MDILFLKIVSIVFSICFIVDYTDIIENINKLIYEKLTKLKWKGQMFKLFSCSLCLSFWCILTFMLINSINIIYSLSIACLASYMSQYITRILYKLKI